MGVMSIMCGESQCRTFFFCLENVVIPNYNKCCKLTLIQKSEETLSTRVLKAQFIVVFDRLNLSYSYTFILLDERYIDLF